ncbi:MAG: hypothetical protein K0Q47_45 [Sedimentibacter sp.]|jgi:hypothetical protein|nr:hypothetical protein [Sedimentibacter sp.]
MLSNEERAYLIHLADSGNKANDVIRKENDIKQMIDFLEGALKIEPPVLEVTIKYKGRCIGLSNLVDIPFAHEKINEIISNELKEYKREDGELKIPKSIDQDRLRQYINSITDK